MNEKTTREKRDIFKYQRFFVIKWLSIIFGCVFMYIGMSIMSEISKSAFHEMEGLLCFMIAAVLIIGAYFLDGWGTLIKAINGMKG